MIEISEALPGIVPPPTLIGVREANAPPATKTPSSTSTAMDTNLALMELPPVGTLVHMTEPLKA
jgi:hypothetical protein